MTRRPPVQSRRQRVHQQEYTRPFIPGHIWSQLPPEAKEILLKHGPAKSKTHDSNTEKGKVHITDSNPGKDYSSDNTSVQTVDMHSNAGTDVSNLQNTSVNTTDRQPQSSSSEPGSDFLRQILSTSQNSPGTRKTFNAENTSSTTININGKLYRQVSTH